MRAQTEQKQPFLFQSKRLDILLANLCVQMYHVCLLSWTHTTYSQMVFEKDKKRRKLRIEKFRINQTNAMNAHRIQYSYEFQSKRWIVDEYVSFGCYSARSIVRPRILFHFFPLAYVKTGVTINDSMLRHTRTAPTVYHRHMTRRIQTHFTIGIYEFFRTNAKYLLRFFIVINVPFCDVDVMDSLATIHHMGLACVCAASCPTKDGRKCRWDNRCEHLACMCDHILYISHI